MFCKEAKEHIAQPQHVATHNKLTRPFGEEYMKRYTADITIKKLLLQCHYKAFEYSWICSYSMDRSDVCLYPLLLAISFYIQSFRLSFSCYKTISRY